VGGQGGLTLQGGASMLSSDERGRKKDVPGERKGEEREEKLR